ncbi:protein of unknown function [Azospirillum baldaniorum]|uniref:Uncharacterized protein n=1 Tax=Azospirillum baldaniorum TaxID=1064539 RepID=A0A9P1JTB9_9PROT|nr:protein of unknown function [Azospirillum baldaniorum]
MDNLRHLIQSSGSHVFRIPKGVVRR